MKKKYECFVYFRYHNDAVDQLRLFINSSIDTVAKAKRYLRTLKSDVHELFLSDNHGSMIKIFRKDGL